MTPGDYGAEGTIEQVGWDLSDESRGTQANSSVGDVGTQCQRISSVYVYSPNQQGGMEFGWVIGWSNCAGTFDDTRARAFYWAVDQTGGFVDCSTFGRVDPQE